MSESYLYGPRELKTPGSTEWCLQTLALLKTRWLRLVTAAEGWDETLREAEHYLIWDKVPPDNPYGDPNLFAREELGIDDLGETAVVIRDYLSQTKDDASE